MVRFFRMKDIAPLSFLRGMYLFPLLHDINDDLTVKFSVGSCTYTCLTPIAQKCYFLSIASKKVLFFSYNALQCICYILIFIGKTKQNSVYATLWLQLLDEGNFTHRLVCVQLCQSLFTQVYC